METPKRSASMASSSRPVNHRANSSLGFLPSSALSASGSDGRSVLYASGHPPLSRDQLISSSDLAHSLTALDQLMLQAKQYRTALMQLSKATNGFAAALEACARVKGAACPVSAEAIADDQDDEDDESGHQVHSGLLAFGGLANVLGSHEHILADSFYRSFEIPLLSLLDDYRAAAAERRSMFDAAIREKGAQIRKTEVEQLRRGRARRDLGDFRRALGELQRQVDEMDDVKVQYYREVLEGEHELWNTVLDKTAFAMKAQLDVADKIASKSSDPSLEHLVASHEDPFGQHATPSSSEIFSVLAPLNVLASMPKSPVPDQGHGKMQVQAFADLSVAHEEDEEDQATPDVPAHHVLLPGSEHQDVWDATETDHGDEEVYSP